MDIHVQSYKTDTYKKSEINIWIRLYNKMPGYIQEMDNYKAFKKDLKYFLLYHAVHSQEEFISLYFMSNVSFSFQAYIFYKHMVSPLKYFVESWSK
jgi:hypothetical protein